MYPPNIHKLNNEFSLSTEKLSATEGMLLPHAKILIQKGFMVILKFIPNLYKLNIIVIAEI